MTTWDCVTAGHVLVDQDPECLICGTVLTADDAFVLVDRPGQPAAPRNLGELIDPRDVAGIDEWGHAA